MLIHFQQKILSWYFIWYRKLIKLTNDHPVNLFLPPCVLGSLVHENLPVEPVGQSWVLQESDFSLKPEQDPPLLSDTVLYLVDFCNPPPQVLEHDPLVVQPDHWQSTENKVK